MSVGRPIYLLSVERVNDCAGNCLRVLSAGCGVALRRRGKEVTFAIVLGASWGLISVVPKPQNVPLGLRVPSLELRFAFGFA